jgi:hypothetical protein
LGSPGESDSEKQDDERSIVETNEDLDVVVEDRSPLVGWSAVWSGAIVGVALDVLVTTLWFALSFDSHRPVFYNHLTWWIAGTAIGATFIAGLVAGIVHGTRGLGAGFAKGVTTWGLLTLFVLALAVTGLVATGNTHTINTPTGSIDVTTFTFWTGFWSMLIGLGAAAIGGMIGGLVPWRAGATRSAMEGPVAATPRRRATGLHAPGPA